ncbi:MAG TPA: hypothetical protein DCR81_06660 [Smithella sp.]|nr:hypothetical protein [Smithella sp.]
MKEQTAIDNTKGQIILYKNKLEVRLAEETVWLSLNQLADLFERDKSVISRHLHNVFEEKELNKDSVVAKYATTASDGKIYKVEYFNLDAIISVGYRVNSKRGTQFRIWATNILRKHLVDGYTINQKRLKAQQNKINELQDAVRLPGNITLLGDVSDEAKGIVRIITEYSRALNILDDFDHQRLVSPKGTKKSKYNEAVRFSIAYEKRKDFLEPVEIEYLKGKTKLCKSLLEKGQFFNLLLEVISLTEDGETLFYNQQTPFIQKILYFRDHLRELLKSESFKEFKGGKENADKIFQQIDKYISVENHNLPMILLFRKALQIKNNDKLAAVGLLDEAIRIPFGWVRSIPKNLLPSSIALENFLLPGNKEDSSDKSRHWNVFGGISLYKSPEASLKIALAREVQDAKLENYSPESMREFIRDSIANINGIYYVVSMRDQKY